MMHPLFLVRHMIGLVARIAKGTKNNRREIEDGQEENEVSSF